MKKIFLIILAIVVVIVGAIFFFLSKDTTNPYVAECDFSVPEAEIPKFTEVKNNFVHAFRNDKDLPVTGSAIIDMDNDNRDEIFVGGGFSQPDGLFRLVDGKLVNVAKKVGLNQMKKSNTIGAVSFDLDDDGHTDLLLARKDGFYFLRNNGTQFEPQKLDIQLDAKSNPLTITVGDFDNDGDADLFLCNYIRIAKMEGQSIFNQKGYGGKSLLMRNDGDLKFTDVTDEMGLNYVHNTFQGVFVDVDDDGWLDLVVAYDTGEARTYKNEGGKHFRAMPNPITGKFGYPMGIGVGDYDNDTKVDFFFSNTGSTIPSFMGKGDLKDNQELVTDWLLFRNEGNFQFKDDAKRAQIAKFEFSWGAIFEDFNLDGRQDLVVAENYVAFPGHKLFKLPCRFLIQRDGQTFAAVEQQAKVINKNYAITPLSAHLNDDNYPDLVYINLDGPLKVFLHDGSMNHAIRLNFPERSEYVGAKAILTTKKGLQMSDTYIIGEGLGGDQSGTLTFGIPEGDVPVSIKIHLVNGKEWVLDSIKSDEIIQLEENH